MTAWEAAEKVLEKLDEGTMSFSDGNVGHTVVTNRANGRAIVIMDGYDPSIRARPGYFHPSTPIDDMVAELQKTHRRA